ncbi:MAG: response regulator [Elusimicrobia bacterium]|nr:response regulator [Elusimicrobiota bacterium]
MKKRRIFVVDDDPEILKLIHSVLEEHGYEVESFDRAASAYEELKRKSADLVFLDVDMPGTDGLELCRILKNDAAFQSTHIIMLTAHEDMKIVERAFNFGAEDYLVKRIFNEDLLLQKVQRAFQPHLPQ